MPSNRKKTLIKAKLLTDLKRDYARAKAYYDFPEDPRLGEYYRGRYTYLLSLIQNVEKGQYE